MFIRFAAPALAIIALAGCQSMMPKPPAPVDLAFDAEQHTLYGMPGTGEISGQAFLRQNGGGVVTCAGNKIFAAPDTHYFRQVAAIARAGGQIAGGMDAGAKTLMRETYCDAQGNFTVTGLSSGKWLVMAEVTWMVGYARQGGPLIKSVPVTSGTTATALLSDADRYTW